ncbi:MAG: hypothetical protein WC806_02285, partial [Candidatus Gracilibacteria bacterium]
MYNRFRQEKYSSFDYLLPFLVLVCIGLILVLGFNLWRTFGTEASIKAAYLHFESGNAKMKTWGTNEFFEINSDALIMQGDQIVFSADATGIVEFVDGTIMRVSDGSDITFVEVDENGGLINLLLADGKVWFNKVYNDAGDTNIIVKTTNLEVTSSNSAIFEIENEFDEIVRVFSGSGDALVVKIFDKAGEKSVDEEKIGVGQEIEFTDKVLERYWVFQSPSVLSAISDEFK